MVSPYIYSIVYTVCMVPLIRMKAFVFKHPLAFNFGLVTQNLIIHMEYHIIVSFLFQKKKYILLLSMSLGHYSLVV
jgi:hypothetical protein